MIIKTVLPLAVNQGQNLDVYRKSLMQSPLYKRLSRCMDNPTLLLRGITPAEQAAAFLFQFLICVICLLPISLPIPQGGVLTVLSVNTY